MYDNGVIVGSAVVIPDIVDVKVIEKNNNPKVVKVTFSDNTVEKAVLDENDTYSLEQGISICITKRILSKDAGVGSSIYNKLISHAMSVMKNNEEEAEQEAKELAAEKARAEKIATKKKQRAEKRALKQREDYINAHAEAFLRAMRKMREEDKADVDEALGEFEAALKQLLGEEGTEKLTDENKSQE